MSLYLVEGPEQDDVLSLADAKLHLRVDFDDDDELIESYVATAIQNIDGRDGWLGRAIGEQTWELRLSEFCGNEIKIPLPPLIEVESVKYYDADDALQTLAPGDYEVVGIGGFGKARVVLKSGKRWPEIAKRAENVVVRFRAGYPTDGGSPAAPTVPAPILTAIKRQVATMYENREAVVVNATVTKLPGGVEALLTPLRVW
ncbi:MAG: head-tail connector protein [Pseudolabrys sp.]|nr:head-tail connector protein [Pseudolabrys sp.]